MSSATSALKKSDRLQLGDCGFEFGFGEGVLLFVRRLAVEFGVRFHEGDAKTLKGKGVSFMESNPEFHGKAPSKEQYAQAKAELEATIAKLKSV